jgi:hypothetical protein
MTANPDEIKRRELLCRDAIKHAFETDEDEEHARLFVSHHLEELESSFWTRHLSTERPAPSAVLGLLQLQSHWGDHDELEIFDFTLPGDVTDYVLSVRFDDEGKVLDVSMES